MGAGDGHPYGRRAPVPIPPEEAPCSHVSPPASDTMEVIALWLVALVGLFAAKGAFGGLADGGRLPGTDSQKAYDLARGGDAEPDRRLRDRRFHDAAGLDRPSTAAAVRFYLDQVRALPASPR